MVEGMNIGFREDRRCMLRSNGGSYGEELVK